MRHCRNRCTTLSFAVLFFLLISIAVSAQTVSSAPRQSDTPGPAQNGGGVTSGPRIWLQANQPLPVQHVAVSLSQGEGMQMADSSALTGLGNAQPVSLASADLDADGIDDLVVGYRAAGGGFISIHRGNMDAFAPQSEASFQAIARGEFPSPFQLQAKTFSVPVSPDFIALGNFAGSGNTDLAVAAKGGSTLYIFPGDGKGNFGQAQTVNLGDGANSLAAGEFGGSHMPVLMVGGSRSLTVYVPTLQGLSALASYKLSAPASNILFGEFGDAGQDVAFLSGGKVQILRSANMQVGTVSLPVTVRAFALGAFIFDRNGGSQIALVAPDGSVQIAVRNEFDPRTYSNQEFQAIRQARLRNQALPSFYPAKSFAGNGWRVVESFPGAASLGPGQTPVVLRTRISVHAADDVMVLNAFSGQMVLISHAGSQAGAQTFQPGQVSLRPYTGTPIVALPLRTNVDVRPGVIALHQGEVAPSLINPIPDPTFTVNTTNDGVFPGACAANTANECTVREAILESDGDTIMVPAGTYTLTIARVEGDCTGKFGALSIGGSPSGGDGKTVTMIGAAQNTTIIQAGTVAYNQGTANGVDMVMNVNEDLGTTNCAITSASASLSNLTLQNGHNRGTVGNFDGDGGCMEFDTGTNGTANLTLTNVTLQNCDTTDGNGGGLANFNSIVNGAGLATISNSIIQGNSVKQVTGGDTGTGGGIWVSDPSRMSLSSSQVKNNLATNSGGGNAGSGGGITITSNESGSRQTVIHASTISGNQAAGLGGGIETTANLLVDQGSIISNNQGGTASVTNLQNGGGIYMHTSANGCPSACTDSVTLTKVTITGNSTTLNGGGISNGDISGGTAPTAGPLTMSFSRLAGNTAAGISNNIRNDGTSITATNNWWGTNDAGSTISTINSGTTTFDPFIVLTHTGSPQEIKITASSTLTGNMSQDNHGSGTALSGNLDEIVGLPITFNGAVLGTIPQAQPETLGNPVPTATATFNAGGTAGLGTANATVDQAVVPVNSNLIASASESSTTVTITTVGAHGFTTGEFVSITGVGTGYNGQFFPITSTATATTFTYTAGTSGLATVNNSGTANAGIVILEPPSITKSFSPTTVAENTASTITFSITNGNVVPIDGSFTDSLPTNLVVATPPTVVNGCGGTVTATAGAATISFSNASLPAGPCSIQVNVQSAVDNTYVNSVTIDSTAAGDQATAATATLTVINPPHITKAFSPTSIPFGDTSTLTFTLSSSNTNLTLNGVAFTDTFPAGLVVATPSNLASTCNGTASATGGGTSVALTNASLAPGTSCTVSVSVTGTAPGTFNNSVQVTSTNGGTGNTSNATLTVTKANTSTTVTSSVNPSVFGQSVTFTATVSAVPPGAGTPTGTVTFLDGGSPIGTGTLSGGIATFATSALAVGSHTITTSYGGDTDFNGSTGSLTGNPQVVNKANTATTVTSSVNPSVFGQSVTFTASVLAVPPGAGTPTGTVTFLDGGSPIGSGTIIGGVATFATSALAVGNHTITTNYGGDGNFNGSTSSLTGNPQVVNKADTSQTVTSSANPQTAGQPVTFTATVSAVAPGAGTPTGNVEFLDNGNPINDCGGATGEPLSGGIATCTTSTLSPGNHTITTSYGGDGNFNGSTGSLTGNPQVITQASTTTTVTSSAGTITLGDTVTFTATVTAASGTATGLVTFFDGNTPLGSATLQPVSGNQQASISTSVLSAAGSPHSIKATYQGATSFAGSTSSAISETVNERTSTTGVAMNPTSVVVGQSSTATVTVTDSGSVPPGTADTFTTTGAPATGRTGFTSTLFADGLVLVAGGTDANNNVLNSAEIYSVSGAAFTATGNLNTARTGAVAVLLPTGKVLIAGGSSNGLATGALNTAELFDPGSGTFSVAGSGSSNTMTAARFGATATLLNTGKVLIAGGENSGGVLNSAELYNPATDTFTATGNLNTARTGASATLLGTGKVLVAGGSSDGTANGALNSAEVFDPAGNAGAGTFTTVAGSNPTLAAGRWQPEAALLLSGKVLVAGGQNSGGALTSADLYDPVADSFTPSNQSMSQARANGSAVSLPSGMVLLAGGTTSQAVDLYDADSDRFDTTGSLQQSDNGLVSTLLNNGDVLVVGLTTAATPASDAELYSPSFNPLGTVGVTSSETTDSITGACTLTPSTSTASTCNSTVTPVNVATSPHTITGTYPKDAVHSGSNGTASLTVTPDNTTTTITSNTPNPSAVNQAVSVSVTVTANSPGSGTPTGTVTVSDGVGQTCVITLSSGAGSCSLTPTAAGVDTLVATYSGDANFNGSTSAGVSQTVVAPPSISKAFNPTSIPLNGTSTLTFTITNPAGNTVAETGVAFTDTLPTGLIVATPSGLTNSCGGTPSATAGGTSISLTGGSIAVSSSCTVVVNITATVAGSFTNTTGAVSSTNGGTGNTATASLTVVAPPSIAKVFSPNSIPLNGTSTLTFTITNPAANTVAEAGVAFSDTLPTGVVVANPNALTNSCGGTPSATAGGTSISLTGGSVATASSCTVVVNVTGTTAGAFVNTTGAVSSTNGGTGNTASAPLTVIAPPSIAKAFNPTTIPVNGTSTLTFRITNPAANTVAEAGVAFSDTLPTGLVVANPNGLVNGCSGTASATAGGTSISLTGGSVAVNSTCTITVNVTGTASGRYTNTTGAVSSTNGGTGNTATANLSVASPPSIIKSFGAASIPLNGTTTLSFNISNPNTIGLTGVAFTDSLPSGLVVASTPNITNTCNGTVTATGGSSVVSLSNGTIAASGSCAVSVNVTGTTPGIKNNTVTVSSNEGGTGNTSTASITVVSPPTISKSFGAASIPLNGSTSLSFALSNPNATVGLSGIGFTDTLPAGLVISSPNGLSSTCNGTITATQGSGVVSLSGATLSASSSCTFRVNVTGTTAGSKVNTTGNVTSNEGGTGGTATATLHVEAPPSIAKAFNPSTIAPTGVSTLTFTITNPAVNLDPEAGVAFSDTFPAKLVVASPNGAVNNCGGTLSAVAGSGSVSLTGGSIAVASSCTVSVNVTSTVPGSYNNVSGAVSSTNGGTGNTATATLNVAHASLAITKTHNGMFDRGSSGNEYTITVSDSANAGPTIGTVTVKDTLPNVEHTLVPTAISGTGWTCTLKTLTCTRSDALAPGASYPAITLTVSVPIGIGGSTVTNSATVSGGGDPNGHTANDPTRIFPPD